MATVRGFVEKIKFRNEDNGYTIFNLNNSDGDLTCVGKFHYIEEGELLEAERQIAFLRMGMDINAWLVSRSLWNAEQSQDVETLCASVITTWSYDALGAGAEMVLSLSGMGAIENAGDLEHEVLTPEKS